MQYNVLNACVTVKEIISQEKYYRIKGNPIDMYNVHMRVYGLEPCLPHMYFFWRSIQEIPSNFMVATQCSVLLISQL